MPIAFPKWSLKFDYQHWLILIGSTIGGASLGYLENQTPGALIAGFSSWAAFAPIWHAVLLADVTALIALAKQKPAPGPTTPSGGLPMATLMFVAVLGLSAVVGSACAKAVPAVGPTMSCVSSVITDALSGMGIAEILAKAGPGCVADAEDVIAILMGSGANKPAVRETVAYRQAAAGWHPVTP